MSKVVLVLSGGGAKAIAHAGAYRALEQANLVPSHIVATSMGGVIGAAIAAGTPYEEIRRRAMSLRRKDIAPFDPMVLVKGLFTRSLFPATALRRAIARLVPKTHFEHLRIPLTVTAVDVESGELLLLGGRERRGHEFDRRGRDIELEDALYATCALPLYFPPLEADGRRLADGGLRAVLPLNAARQLEPDADLFVAIHIGPGFDEHSAEAGSAAQLKIPRVIRTHGEALWAMMADQTEREVAAWPKDGPKLIYVRAVVEREATFAADRAQAYMEMGFQTTKRALG
ncbi:MAG TPA: patatin-like phospholipase family protein [Gemmatimonadales bacterium]|nr:patatin-like phospholipase family protein [Gemmatimonadales bacterium]